MNTITLTCPGCGHVMNAPAQYAGRRGTCARCKTKLIVPQSAPDLVLDEEPVRRAHPITAFYLTLGLLTICGMVVLATHHSFPLTSTIVAPDPPLTPHQLTPAAVQSDIEYYCKQAGLTNISWGAGSFDVDHYADGTAREHSLEVSRDASGQVMGQLDDTSKDAYNRLNSRYVSFSWTIYYSHCGGGLYKPTLVDLGPPMDDWGRLSGTYWEMSSKTGHKMKFVNRVHVVSR